MVMEQRSHRLRDGLRTLTVAIAALALLVGSCAAGVPATVARAGAQAAPTTIIYGATDEPDTLNPQITTQNVSGDINAGVFGSLLKVDAHDNFIPDLATRWSVSADNLTYTFRLRRGVYWADGAPFTARDVAFTHRQILNPKNNTNSVQGWDRVTRLETPDAYTVILHTRQVYAPLLLYVGTTAVLPAHYFAHSPTFLKEGSYNHDPFNRAPFGTGPYMVTEWATADHITLVPNPHYWGTRPYFQKIIFKIVPDANTLLVQAHTHEVDLATVTQEQVRQAAALSGKVLVQAPGQSWYHVELKQWGFLRDRQVRVALDYATPRDAIVRQLLHGYAQPAYGDIAPISWAYDPTVPHRRFDSARARAMLAADGFTRGRDGSLWKDGQELAMQLWYITGNPVEEQINEILRRSWSQIGVKVELRHQDNASIWGPNGPQFTKQMTGISTGTTDTDDPDDRFYWNSAEIPTCPTCPGGNWIAYFHRFSFQQQIDALTDAAVATLDRGERKALYARIERLLADQVPMIFLDWVPLLYVRPAGLQGFAPNAFMYGLFWNIQQWHY